MIVLKGKGFILRPIKLNDSKLYWEVMQDKETAKGFMGVPSSFEEAKKEVKDFIKKTKKGVSQVFTILVDGKYAGNVKLDYQNWDKNSSEGRVHLWLHPDYRGKGLATKALKKIINYGFKIKKMKIIYAQCKKSNKAVCKVNEKVGFRKVENRIVNGVKKVWWEINIC
ncbi:MAG: GNAT family N-acetyltransferase [Nanoarchaeota archaeon]|nr:GNAT family N-acetyltransferase [Nanoarchaeota archaeon]